MLEDGGGGGIELRLLKLCLGFVVLLAAGGFAAETPVRVVGFGVEESCLTGDFVGDCI